MLRVHLCAAGSYIISDVGLTAYEGAIAQLTNYTNIALAAKILAVEAFHATAVRLKLFESGALPLKPYTTQIVDVAQVLFAASQLPPAGP